MSDCLSAGLASHNFKGFHTQRCIDCNLRLADFVATSIYEALHSERARLAGLVEGLKRIMAEYDKVDESTWYLPHEDGQFLIRTEVLALLEGKEG